jgi:negative regulator of flagellin synthesis FlgM
MKIDANPNIVNVEKNAVENAQTNVVQQENKVAAESAVVKVSSRAEDLAMIQSELANVPEVREDKVAELKAQIEAGTYKPDMNVTAERMLTESLMMSALG